MTDYGYVNKVALRAKTRRATLRSDEEPDDDMLTFNERQEREWREASRKWDEANEVPPY